jgi:hypothetical protein
MMFLMIAKVITGDKRPENWQLSGLGTMRISVASFWLFMRKETTKVK